MIALAATFPACSTAYAECLVEQNDVGLGFILPSEGCRVTVHSDVALSMVTTDWSRYGLHGDAEIGVLGAVPGFAPLHLGGVVALGGDSIPDERTGDRSVFEAKTLLRGHLWLPPDHDGLVYVDFALGPTFIAPTSSDEPSRVGLYAELGLSVHGGIGLFFGAEPTFSVDDGTVRPRYTLGGKTTAAGFLLALSIYVCAQSHC